jgi:hypothetical protein
VTIVGAVPLPSIDGDAVKKAAFRIAGKIDIEAMKSRPRPTKPATAAFASGTRSVQALYRLYRQPGAPHS